jgi:predicted membrane channel-forming protein YqfA (hemolysin III family)
MDDAVWSLATAVAAIALTLLLFVIIAKSAAFARLGKVAFLAAWGFGVTALPVIGAVLALQTEHAVASAVGCAGVLLIGGVSFYYLGWPELRRTLSQ